MHWNFYCLYYLLSCSCDKTLWPKELKEHLFVLAVPEGEETIMVGKHGRRQQARQPKGSESFQLQMQVQNKISKLAVVKGFNIKVRFQELTYSTQLQLLNLLKEHPHVRTKYSNDHVTILFIGVVLGCNRYGSCILFPNSLMTLNIFYVA